MQSFIKMHQPHRRPLDPNGHFAFHALWQILSHLHNPLINNKSQVEISISHLFPGSEKQYSDALCRKSPDLTSVSAYLLKNVDSPSFRHHVREFAKLLYCKILLERTESEKENKVVLLDEAMLVIKSIEHGPSYLIIKAVNDLLVKIKSVTTDIRYFTEILHFKAVMTETLEDAEILYQHYALLDDITNPKVNPANELLVDALRKSLDKTDNLFLKKAYLKKLTALNDKKSIHALAKIEYELIHTDSKRIKSEGDTNSLSDSLLSEIKKLSTHHPTNQYFIEVEEKKGLSKVDIKHALKYLVEFYDKDNDLKLLKESQLATVSELDERWLYALKSLDKRDTENAGFSYLVEDFEEWVYRSLGDEKLSEVKQKLVTHEVKEPDLNCKRLLVLAELHLIMAKQFPEEQYTYEAFRYIYSVENIIPELSSANRQEAILTIARLIPGSYELLQATYNESIFELSFMFKNIKDMIDKEESFYATEKELYLSLQRAKLTVKILQHLKDPDLTYKYFQLVLNDLKVLYRTSFSRVHCHSIINKLNIMIKSIQDKKTIRLFLSEKAEMTNRIEDAEAFYQYCVDIKDSQVEDAKNSYINRLKNTILATLDLKYKKTCLIRLVELQHEALPQLASVECEIKYSDLEKISASEEKIAQLFNLSREVKELLFAKRVLRDLENDIVHLEEKHGKVELTTKILHFQIELAKHYVDAADFYPHEKDGFLVNAARCLIKIHKKNLQNLPLDDSIALDKLWISLSSTGFTANPHELIKFGKLAFTRGTKETQASAFVFFRKVFQQNCHHLMDINDMELFSSVCHDLIANYIPADSDNLQEAFKFFKFMLAKHDALKDKHSKLSPDWLLLHTESWFKKFGSFIDPQEVSVLLNTILPQDLWLKVISVQMKRIWIETNDLRFFSINQNSKDACTGMEWVRSLLTVDLEEENEFNHESKVFLKTHRHLPYGESLFQYYETSKGDNVWNHRASNARNQLARLAQTGDPVSIFLLMKAYYKKIKVKINKPESSKDLKKCLTYFVKANSFKDQFLKITEHGSNALLAEKINIPVEILDIDRAKAEEYAFRYDVLAKAVQDKLEKQSTHKPGFFNASHKTTVDEMPVSSSARLPSLSLNT